MQQVRTLSHNSLQLQSLIDSDRNTVVGQGLNLSPEPRFQILGIDPKIAEEWSSDTAQRFELWCMDRRASRNGMYNFFQAQRLMQTCKNRDGELLVHLSYDNDPTLLSPLRFQILDPSQIREQGFTSAGTGLSLDTHSKEGIIRNRDGEAVAYKVWSNNSLGIPEMKTIPRIGRGGRIMMLHAFDGLDYAGQLRGISSFATCVQELEQILDYTLAEVNKATNQSNIIFTGESDTDEPFEPPWKNMSGNGAGPIPPHVKQYGTDPDPDPNAQNVTEESLEPVYIEIPHTSLDKPGSAAVFMPKGRQKLKPFQNTAPSTQFNTFVDAMFKYIAASRGQSIETTLMQFNQNYSGSRATLILVWRIAVQRRWELDYYILGPMYEMWLAEEIAAGRRSCPGWADPRLRAAWIAHKFTGQPMPNIDPLKTAQSNKMAVELGSTTLEEAAQEYNDSDYESNCIKNTEAYKNHPAPPWGWTDERGSVTGGEDSAKEEE
jgi:capsid protein